MRLRNMVLTFLFVSLLTHECFAKPGIKIVEPQDGAIVHPGEEINLRIEAVDGLMVTELEVMSKEIYEQFYSLPVTFKIKIPIESVGTFYIAASGCSTPNECGFAEINLKVEQTAILNSLEIDQDKVWIGLDWNGNIKEELSGGGIARVYGVYSDGVTRDISEDLNTTYISSDPSIISVDNEGNYKLHKVGNASITVSNSGINKVIPVVFEKPTGIRPTETIPPTIQIKIDPQPNSEGWNNSDIKITLTAKDNEGGSGIKEIFYEFPYISAESNDILNDQVVIPFSIEGINLFRYGATDKERNDTGQQSVELSIDKTPPVIAITATPNVLWPPDNKMAVVTINGQATDNLSGIEILTFKVVDEYGKVQPSIAGFGSTIKLEASRKGEDKDGRIYIITAIAKDKAGNESSASTTVTVPHDMGK